jgi:chitin synthase
MLHGDSNGNKKRISAKNYIYIVPCYTETKQELVKTLNSIVLQRDVKNDIRSILIVCDGSSQNKNNICDKVLKEILNITDEPSEDYKYTTWDKKENLVKIYKAYYSYLNESLPVILLIKDQNYGKRDSLVLIRNFCYKYNQSLLLDSESIVDSEEQSNLIVEMINNLSYIYGNEEINYIIGIDADTAFDYNCSYELIKSIHDSSDIHGCVGYVDIEPTSFFYSPFILYQYAEYMFAQCLRRHAQSLITQKVNCLSGCVQILRVSKETCGDEILKVFNYLPAAEENIFNHIRSYASEDRNHVCNLLSLYPYAKTVQNLDAVAYTTVPTSWSVFLSQRRRWSLGANANDMLLIYLPDIFLVERISAFINVFTYSLSPFIFVATILFIKAIITEATMLMLYLSSVIFVPLGYALLIVPIFVKPISFRNTLYYYFSYFFFYLVCSIVNLIIYFYSIFCMDVIKWGKTRQIKEQTNTEGLMYDDDVYITVYGEITPEPAPTPAPEYYLAVDHNKSVNEYAVVNEYEVVNNENVDNIL